MSIRPEVSSSSEVSQIRVGPIASGDSVATFILDYREPISKLEADRVRHNLITSLPVQESMTGLEDTMVCDNDIKKDDKRTGVLHLRLQCLVSVGGSAVLNWGFQMSSGVKALIPGAGPVQEHGMTWFRNGSNPRQNAAHKDSDAESKDYLWHGTLNPVFVNDTVDYQDRFTFPTEHPGGTGTLAVAGRVHLKSAP